MSVRPLLSALSLLLLSACIATPRIEIPDQLSFNYVVPNQQPMSYSEIMCCVDCQV